MKVRRGFARATVVALAAVIGVGMAATPALAAPQTKTINLSFSGSANPNVAFSVTGVCDDCVPDFVGPGPGSWGLGAQIDTTVTGLTWSGSATTDVTYDDTLLRQGQTLNLTDTLTTIPGIIKATGTLTGSISLFNDPTGGTNWQPYSTLQAVNKPLNLTFACGLPLPGSPPADCNSGSIGIPLASIAVIPGVPEIDAVLSVHSTLDVTVTGGGVATVRAAQVLGGGSAQTAPLTFGGTSPSTVGDALHLSCSEPAGNDLQYGFTNTTYSPGVGTATTTALHMEAVLTHNPLPPFTDINLFGGDVASTTTPIASLSVPLTAPDQSADLGAVAKNNVPPVVNAGGPYAGNEGSPITFDGSGSSSICGFPTLRWDFSDGGVAFGAHPQHTFPGSGTYSGLLTATDATGLTSMTTFSVGITNLPPVVDAGPGTTAAWGVPVAFNGSATDPGSADQSTLTYSWNFGDGSPSASGGASVFHSYSTPGDYTATLTSCDQYNACASSSRVVHVVKRNTTTAYLGDTAGTYNTPAALSASLVDEFGQPVNGRSITFQVGTDGPFTALTNSSGIATRSYTPTLAQGAYTGSSTFAGDTLYNPSSSSNSFAVAKKGTITTYTGPTTGGPNKTIVLSATLTDASGTPLAGKTITFQLGTQTVSAVTNANGVASASLKLNQKNGIYSVSATYAPAPADQPFYLGSANVTTFKLQTK